MRECKPRCFERFRRITLRRGCRQPAFAGLAAVQTQVNRRRRSPWLERVDSSARVHPRGRKDIVRSVNVFPTQIEEQVLKCPGLAAHFQIELTRQGRLDEITVVVEARADQASQDARAASADELSRHIKGTIGISAQIEVNDPGAVPRSEGKAKRILDLRPRE